MWLLSLRHLRYSRLMAGKYYTCDCYHKNFAKYLDYQSNTQNFNANNANGATGDKLQRSGDRAKSVRSTLLTSTEVQ
jgi:hypothetical protein